MRMNIPSYTDFEDLEDQEIDVKKISWFRVKAKLHQTPQESREMQEAKQHQINAGILQRNGLPSGMSVLDYQKQVQAAQKAANKASQKAQKAIPRNESKWQRKHRRAQERAAQKAAKIKSNVNYSNPQKQRFHEQAKRDENAILQKILGG